LFFAHVRASTGTATTRANCHPFRFGRWLFMHNGQIGGWQRLRRQIEMAIPDELFAHRHGTTDSEVIFLLMLANGLDADPEKSCVRTFGFIEGVMRRAGEKEPLRCTAAFSDGEQLFAVRYASNRAPDTLYTRNRRDNSGKLLVSEPLDDGRDDWREVPAQSFVSLGRLGDGVKPFEVALAA
jgi:glutamine amidotransferase